MSFTTVTITGQYSRPNGEPAQGTITATVSNPITNAGVTVEATPITGQLNSEGKLVNQAGDAFTLIANNDAGTTPTGTVYGFVLQLDNEPVDAFYAVVPHTSSTIGLSELTPVESVAAMAAYIPLAQKGAANGVPSSAEALAITGIPAAGQVLTATAAAAAHWAMPLMRTAHAWVVAGEVKAETLPGLTVVPLTGEEVKAARLDYKIREGTKVTFKLQKGGVDLTGFTGLEASTAAAHVAPTAVAIASGEEITLVVESVEGSPKGFSATLQLEHVG